MRPLPTLFPSLEDHSDKIWFLLREDFPPPRLPQSFKTHLKDTWAFVPPIGCVTLGKFLNPLNLSYFAQKRRKIRATS